MDHAAAMADHGLMQGMLWGSLLMMSVPILLGLGIGIYALRRWLEDRREAARSDGPDGADEPGTGNDDGGSPPRRPPPAPELDDPDRKPFPAADHVGGEVTASR